MDLVTREYLVYQIATKELPLMQELLNNFITDIRQQAEALRIDLPLEIEVMLILVLIENLE